MAQVVAAQQRTISAKEGEMTRKRVSFRDFDERLLADTRTIPGLSELSPAEVRRQWFGPDDFLAFKTNAKLIAMQASRSLFNDLLEDSFRSDSSGEDPLLKWSRYGNLRRGLELSVSPKHGVERSRKKKEALRAVINAQHMHRSNGMVQEDMDRLITTVYVKHTKEAALFAQRMGKADADAILVETRPCTSSPGSLRPPQTMLIESFKMSKSDPSLCCSLIISMAQRR
ncbi:hypothetical protein MHU86_6290 [Fragilaria crotonensis]|nr:hypothetical protein MHU86_6290 [Fragilaria crotonensis]